MIELLKAILFGIVERTTEWLPVSSTGHMIILDEFIKLDCTPEFLEMFLVVIQLGAILAVVILFWNKIFPFQFRDKDKPVIEMDKIMLWLKIVVACIPAAVVGILFDDVFEALFYHASCVALALIVFGVAFIIVERRNKGRRAKVRKLDDITFQTSFTTLEAGVLIIGMLVSFFVSVFVIKFLMDYIKKHDFQVFGWYRIVLGILVLVLGAVGVINV